MSLTSIDELHPSAVIHFRFHNASTVTRSLMKFKKKIKKSKEPL